MKKLIIAAVLIVFGLSANVDANTNYSKRVGGYFYTSLSPYGTWMEIGFGSPVWRPTNIRRNWSPYSQGQWIYTDYGWYWDSFEPFGEVVYHYGRWYFDDYYGWIWIPDYEWAPAWVDWRYDDDYIGWAPLSPYALFSINIGIHYTYDYYVPYNHWNYVKYNHFCDDNVYNYYVGSKYKYRVYNKTKMRTNYSYYNGRVRNEGVDFDRIRERSGRKIEKRNIVTYSNPMELTKVRDSKNSNREIRTYIASRDDISRDGLRDVKIERSKRKSTLEISKVELGRDRNSDRTNDKIDNRKIEDSRKIEKKENDRTVNQREVIRDTKKETNNDITRKKNEEDRKIQERKDVQKNNSELQKRNNEQNKRNEEIKKSEELKRNDQKKRNEQIELQRKANEEIKKRNEVTIQKREEKKVNTEVSKQNNDRKIQQRQNIQKTEQRNQNLNNNRNTEVKRNSTNNRNQTKDNTRTSGKDSRDIKR